MHIKCLECICAHAHSVSLQSDITNPLNPSSFKTLKGHQIQNSVLHDACI